MTIDLLGPKGIKIWKAFWEDNTHKDNPCNVFDKLEYSFQTPITQLSYNEKTYNTKQGDEKAAGVT